MLHEKIDRLVKYGMESGLIPPCEEIYTRNLLLELFHETDYQISGRNDTAEELDEILEELLNEAVLRGIIEDGIAHRDLFDTKIMNCLTPRPGQVQERFEQEYEKSPVSATDYFYKLCRDNNYIRAGRLKNDMKWKVESKYGEMDITINLSKPEKDPKAIAAAKNEKSSGYPKCLLCVENEGYAGRPDHPARENLRLIPVTMDDAQWWFQYSPYVYYDEHCIVLNNDHVPMKIEGATFRKLFDFVKRFPHYFLGSNADLPIVGGSILSHDHFQGGRYTFAMAKAPVEEYFKIKGYEDVKCGIVKWPLSVIRIQCDDDMRLARLAEKILRSWRDYTDDEAYIFAYTGGVPHNTITPIARKKDGLYELDLVLRNNITTKDHPLGLYHPHEELHHIKKENIGLIEVMGLAVLPARLKREMELLGKYLLEKKDPAQNDELKKHAAWAKEVSRNHPEMNTENIMAILKEEIGKAFVCVLEDAGVFKHTAEGRENFRRFLKVLNNS